MALLDLLRSFSTTTHHWKSMSKWNVNWQKRASSKFDFNLKKTFQLNCRSKLRFLMSMNILSFLIKKVMHYGQMLKSFWVKNIKKNKFVSGYFIEVFCLFKERWSIYGVCSQSKRKCLSEIVVNLWKMNMKKKYSKRTLCSLLK
jgi:hypothetical protein